MQTRIMFSKYNESSMVAAALLGVLIDAPTYDTSTFVSTDEQAHYIWVGVDPSGGAASFERLSELVNNHKRSGSIHEVILNYGGGSGTFDEGYEVIGTLAFFDYKKVETSEHEGDSNFSNWVETGCLGNVFGYTEYYKKCYGAKRPKWEGKELSDVEKDAWRSIGWLVSNYTKVDTKLRLTELAMAYDAINTAYQFHYFNGDLDETGSLYLSGRVSPDDYMVLVRQARAFYQATMVNVSVQRKTSIFGNLGLKKGGNIRVWLFDHKNHLWYIFRRMINLSGSHYASLEVAVKRVVGVTNVKGGVVTSPLETRIIKG